MCVCVRENIKTNIKNIKTTHSDKTTHGILTNVFIDLSLPPEIWC